MASSKLLKEAIADAKAVRETAIANAKIALEEAFTPRLQSILSKKLTAEMEGEEEEVEVNEDNDISTGIGTGDNKQPADKANSAQTDLSGISKETSPEGEELEDYDKVKDLTEAEEEMGDEEAFMENKMSKTKKMVKRLKEDTEYQEFFKKAMDKFKINSPADLKDPAKKKQFFDYIDTNYRAKVETINARRY